MPGAHQGRGLKDEQELQSYFIRRIAKFVSARGRKLIGWSEIEQGGLAQDATVMDWNGGGAEAANSGHDVVMASQEYTYFCYYQSLDRPPKLKGRRRYLPLNKAYAFNPLPAGLKPESESHILGVEACVWTPFFASMHEVEEMSFPRLCGLAEIGWSPKSALNYDDFSRRLKIQQTRLDAAGVAYWNDRAVKIGEWKPAQISAPTNLLEWEVPPQILSPGKFRLSLNYQQGKNGLKISSATLLEDGREVARDAHDGLAGAGYNRPDKAPLDWPLKARDWNYFLNLPQVKPGAKYAVRISASGNGGGDSGGVVFLEPPTAPSKM
jgi:hexosaminidase